MAVLLGVGANAWAYNTPDGYKIGTVYVGTEVNNQVLAETFANYALNTDLTTLSSNWSENTGGTDGYHWAKIKNTVKTVGYPVTDRTTLYTCDKYSATNDGGTTTTNIYSVDGGVTYYKSNDLQSVFDATGYEVTANGTAYQIPSYVYGKCISVQHRSKSDFNIDYTFPTSISTGKLVFGADFYRVQKVEVPLYIRFYDSDDNLVFQLYYENGSGRQNMRYQVGTDDVKSCAGYTEWRAYHGWGLKDLVFDMDEGKVSYSVDNVYWDGSTSPQRRKVSQSAIDFGTGKNIKKVRFYSYGNASRENFDFFIDNMYLYTLVSGTATTEDVTIIGSRDYEDGYLGSTSSDYTIKPNGKLHLKFKNYGSGAQSWNNWFALFNNADKSSDLAYIRADQWDVVSSSNTGIATSDNYWDAFEGDMFGSTVDMLITRTDGNVYMLATVTTTADEEMTLTFDKAIGNAAEDIVFRLSEDAACLVLDNTKTALVAPPTFSQTSMTNTGNPIITVTENTGDSPTAGSAIYYTTNGDTPTTSSIGYTDPVSVTGGNTIKAITTVTATDGTTTLTSSASSLTTTEYVRAQTYDFTVPTTTEIIAEGFSLSNKSVDYGVGSTSRYSQSAGSDGLNVLNGVTLQGSGSTATWWYWMTSQGLWQANGDRSVTLNSILDGEVALFTRYDCRHDGTSWSINSESDYYEADCSYTLSKSNNTGSSGNHVYMVKKVQSFIPAGSTVSATVGANGYATFASPYALDLTDANRPEGLKAYKATLSGTTLTFTALNQTVPAGTGLLLLGENDATYNIPIVANGDDVTNDLVGVTADTPLQSTENGTYYFVMKKASTASDAFAFAPLSTASAVTIPAGKAYVALNTSDGTRSLTVAFDDEAAGIKSVSGEEIMLNGVFNLNGQRVESPAKGLYIMNGKKVILK